MSLKTIRVEYKGQKIPLIVRPETQDEPMAAGEIFGRDYYRKYGNLEINPGDIVVDLGANIGAFSVLSSLCGASRVYAVEAHPETLEILKKNVADYPVSVIEAAVMGEADENAVMYLCNDIKGTGSHTLVLNQNNDPAGFQKITVRATTLDRIIEENNLERIDFLKVDIEGAEYEVIEKSKRLKIVRQISFEWHHGVINFCRLVSYLLYNGFNVAWFEGDSKRGKLQVKRG
jgi:FkbM family methyltransferase